MNEKQATTTLKKDLQDLNGVDYIDILDNINDIANSLGGDIQAIYNAWDDQYNSNNMPTLNDIRDVIKDMLNSF